MRRKKRQEMPVKYSYSFTAASVGSLLLSDLLAGVLYDAEAHRQGAAEPA